MIYSKQLFVIVYTLIVYVVLLEKFKYYLQHNMICRINKINNFRLQLNLFKKQRDDMLRVA